MKYTIYASEVMTYCADVEAQSEEEAKEKFISGTRSTLEHLDNMSFQIDAIYTHQTEATV
jgi:hypothetical protein